MSQTGTTGQPVRSVGLDDGRITAILNHLEAAARPVPHNRRRSKRHSYRSQAVVIYVQQPDSARMDPYLAPTRDLSSGGLSFLHSGFVAPDTPCRIQLFTVQGTWEEVPATVVRCRHVEAGIHEVAVSFKHDLDPQMHCPEPAQLCVLLAEDDPSQARLAMFHLRQLGAMVDHAENGQVAVDKAKGNPYDLILMDMDMPVLDGFSAVSQLRNMGYSGPIVAQTARIGAADRERCLDVGCDKHIPKPYGRDELFALIESLQEQPLLSTFHDFPAMAKLIDAFVAELPAMIRALEEAFAEGDTNRLEYEVRRLKADGSMHGFSPIAEAAAAMETALINRAPPSDVRKHMDQLINRSLLARASWKKVQPRALNGEVSFVDEGSDAKASQANV